MSTAILRFSALGDVAMTVPVISSAAHHNPTERFVVVTRKSFCALYEELNPNVNILPADLKGNHKGIIGLWRLARTLKKQYNVDKVADLHNVLRTKVLRFFLNLMGCQTAHIHKGRREKRRLVKRGWKKSVPLTKQTKRYAEVFKELSFACPEDFSVQTYPAPKLLPKLHRESLKIGVAPASAHSCKTYPQDKLRKVLVSLLENKEATLFFFGKEHDVKKAATELSKSFPDRVFLASSIAKDLREELGLMQQLDAMLSMDSANMHLAALTGLRVISIWGATHPYAGFLAYGAKASDCIQSPRACRPCTIYGAHPRCKAPFPCLEDIKEEHIYQSLLK